MNYLIAFLNFDPDFLDLNIPSFLLALYLLNMSHINPVKSGIKPH